VGRHALLQMTRDLTVIRCHGASTPGSNLLSQWAFRSRVSVCTCVDPWLMKGRALVAEPTSIQRVGQTPASVPARNARRLALLAFYCSTK
jgi:hypothetical protein